MVQLLADFILSSYRVCIISRLNIFIISCIGVLADVCLSESHIQTYLAWRMTFASPRFEYSNPKFGALQIYVKTLEEDTAVVQKSRQRMKI